jgi:hypothetical protein
MNFAEGEPRLYYAGSGVLMALHLVLQRDPVFTGCLWRGIRHCIDMGEQSSRKVRMRVFIVDDSIFMFSLHELSFISGIVRGA